MNFSRQFSVLIAAATLASACTKMDKNVVAPNTAVNNGLDDGKIAYGVIPESAHLDLAALAEEAKVSPPTDVPIERKTRGQGVESAAPGCGAWTTLYSGMGLSRNMVLRSPNCRYVLVLQSDFHLVTYDLYTGRAIWYSDLIGGRADWVVMQSDGNLVGWAGGNARFSSNSYGHPNSRAVLQDDGNFVVYNRRGTAMWSTFTGPLLQSRGGVYKVGAWGDNYCAFSNGPGEAFCWLERSTGRCPAPSSLPDMGWNQSREADHGRCR